MKTLSRDEFGDTVIFELDVQDSAEGQQLLMFDAVGKQAWSWQDARWRVRFTVSSSWNK